MTSQASQASQASKRASIKWRGYKHLLSCGIKALDVLYITTRVFMVVVCFVCWLHVGPNAQQLRRHVRAIHTKAASKSESVRIQDVNLSLSEDLTSAL
jgi:hypothetical protein